jgi:hypothetical protein
MLLKSRAAAEALIACHRAAAEAHAAEELSCKRNVAEYGEACVTFETLQGS